MRCRPALVPRPCRQSSRRGRSTDRSRFSCEVGLLNASVMPSRRSLSLTMSSRPVIDHFDCNSALILTMLSGSGWASSGVSVIQLLPRLSPIRTSALLGNPASRAAKLRAHFRLDALDETIGLDRQIQRRVIGRALGLEVGGQVFVGVAVTVGADDPDFLAAQLLAQCLEHANLVGDAVDALAALGVGLHHGVAPEAADDRRRAARLRRSGRRASCCRRGGAAARSARMTGRWPSLFERNSKAWRTFGTMRR